MSHIVHVAGPTQRPEDPFIREMGDSVAGIERNYEREGAGPGSRFQDQLLADIQASWVVKQTRRRDAVAAVVRFELRTTGWMHETRRRDPLRQGVTSQLMHEYEVFDRIAGVVAGTFVATGDQAQAMLKLLNRNEPFPVAT
jgi:hypothetical protein